MSFDKCVVYQYHSHDIEQFYHCNKSFILLYSQFLPSPILLTIDVLSYLQVCFEAQNF